MSACSEFSSALYTVLARNPVLVITGRTVTVLPLNKTHQRGNFSHICTNKMEQSDGMFYPVFIYLYFAVLFNCYLIAYTFNDLHKHQKVTFTKNP